MDAHAGNLLGVLDDDERRAVEDALALLMKSVCEDPAAAWCR